MSVDQYHISVPIPADLQAELQAQADAMTRYLAHCMANARATLECTAFETLTCRQYGQFTHIATKR